MQQVVVTAGYGLEKETEAEQTKFLNFFKKLLLNAGLPIHSIASERKTGGCVILEVPDHLELEEVTRAFLALATIMARVETRKAGEEIHVSFDIRLPGFTESITIYGTGH